MLDNLDCDLNHRNFGTLCVYISYEHASLFRKCVPDLAAKLVDVTGSIAGGGQMGANEPIVAPSGFRVALGCALTTYNTIKSSYTSGSSCQRIQRVYMGHALLHD